MEADNSIHYIVSQALFFAQIGDVASARKLASQARLQWRTEDSAVLTVDLMLVDGISASYSGDLSSAFDRLSRASLLASMLGDDHRIHLGKAWQATVSFNLGQLAKAEKLVIEASKFLRGVKPNALFRSATVVAVLLQYCGEELAATRWLKFAQRASSDIRHPGLMSHLLYNLAALRVSIRGYLRFFGDISPDATKLDSMAVDSSLNFDAMAATSVQSAFHPLLEAQILSVRGDYLRGFAKIEEFLADSGGISDEFIVQARFERLFLWLNLNRDIPSNELRVLEGEICSLKSNDDIAKAYFILHLATKVSGADDASRNYLGLAMEYKDKHSRQCVELSAGLIESGLFNVPENWWAFL